MSAPRKPVFLARQGYRRRRMVDVSRALPVFGAFLFCLPVLWSRPDGAAGAPRPDLAEQGLYIFAVWGALVAVAGIVALRLRGGEIPGGTRPLPEEMRGRGPGGDGGGDDA